MYHPTASKWGQICKRYQLFKGEILWYLLLLCGPDLTPSILNIPLNQEAVWLQSTGVVMKWANSASRKLFAFQ